MKMMRRSLAAMAAGAILAAGGPVLAQGKVLKFVQNGNLTILDPI
jgi:peptide/nickel transport system substrate-binding protein